jgi:hypothetical protein
MSEHTRKLMTIVLTDILLGSVVVLTGGLLLLRFIR